jgi:hypothetical protein
MEEKDITIYTIIEELLKTDILKRIMYRNGREFAHMLAYWLIRYILVLSSKYELGEDDFEEILYHFHGENFWEIIELSNLFLNNQTESVETSIMN